MGGIVTWVQVIYPSTNPQRSMSLQLLFYASTQGRIYVANEYPTFARTMSIVSQKLTFSRRITLNLRQNLSVLMKNMQILG